MKLFVVSVWLLLAASFLPISQPSVAQERGPQPAGSITEEESRIKDLQRKIRDAEEALSSIKKQASSPTTPGNRRVLAERLERTETEIQRLRDELISIKEVKAKQPSNPVNGPVATAPSCCELTEPANQRNDLPMPASNSCRSSRKNISTDEVMWGRPPDKICRKMTQEISFRKVKKIEVSLSSDQNRFTKGANSFCIKFRSLQDGSPVDPGEVRAEATLSTPRIKLVRAVVRVSRLSTGHYCARVTFRSSGSWLITVKDEGLQGKGKVTFPESFD